jgi:hypothetical protein
MTLQQLFDLLTANPALVVFFVLSIPLTALIAGMLGKGEGHLSPWKQLYCVLSYLAVVPGMFAIILNVYLFLFEKQPIMQTNLYTQVLPILVMLLTLWLIKKNVPFELIPGFDKISGLGVIAFAVLAIMWLLDRTHIIAITIMPFYYVIIFMIIAFFAIRFGMKKIIQT